MLIPLAHEPRAGVRLPIAGLDAQDDHAFPGRRAAVVYLQGCPLQCGYCETASRMGRARRGMPGEWAAIEALLAARSGEIDAVVFSGGEPTLHADLADAAEACRALGLAVGLHTAGPYPERLEALLPWLDWVALDVKGRGTDFDRISGRRGVWQRHARSLSLLLEGAVPFECRTTVHWRDFTLEALEQLAMTLVDCGVRCYAIQLARQERCLDPDYCRPVADAPAPKALESLTRRLRRHFERIELRG